MFIKNYLKSWVVTPWLLVLLFGITSQVPVVAQNSSDEGSTLHNNTNSLPLTTLKHSRSAYTAANVSPSDTVTLQGILHAEFPGLVQLEESEGSIVAIQADGLNLTRYSHGYVALSGYWAGEEGSQYFVAQSAQLDVEEGMRRAESVASDMNTHIMPRSQVKAAGVQAAANQYIVGNATNSDGDFNDSHNPAIFINEEDVYRNRGKTAVTIQVDQFNFYASKDGNPVTPIVVRVDGDNDFTVLAIGQTRSSYNIGANNVAFANSTPVFTLNPGEKIATGFLDSNANGNGWGEGGNPIPAQANGPRNQDEVWSLAPQPLILASAGFVGNRDTSSVALGQKILTTNQGKSLRQYNLRRTYAFSIGFSSDEAFIGATVYQHGNFGGNSASFSDGKYSLNSSAVGNNNVSSIKVDAGYVAYLCDGSFDDPTSCKMYPPGEHSSVASETNDKADVIKVDQNDPARHGRWGDVVAVPQRAIASAHLPDGDILFWNGGPIGNDIYRFDPKTMTLTSSGAPDDHDTFCPGPVLIPNGDLVLAGGAAPTEGASSIFSWASETWDRQVDMVEPHYYGTSVALADGRVFHALGTTKQANDLKSQSNFGEIWDGNAWQKLSGPNLAAVHANNDYFNSNYYPYLHLMPNGNIFHTGGVPNMHEIDLSNQQLIDHGIRAGNDAYRLWGNAIMIDEGMVLISGGRPDDPVSVKTTVLVDFNQATNVTSKYMAPMQYDRGLHNMVQLPTGDIFVSGGNAFGKTFEDHSSVLPGELWDRESNSWTEMAELTVPRNYHSSSLLLPDGRVWLGGGDCNHCDGKNHESLQFYSPSYLFNANGTLAARPEITAFPSGENGIKVSQSFSVKVAGSGSGNIADFNIIRLSATTHQINTDVRRLSLDFTNQGNGNYQIKAHDNVNVMTPGYWMLFAVNNSGVPSEAAIVHVSTQPGTENPSGGNQGNGVTVYAGGGFSGASWSIGAGTYPIADIVASPVGNDKASSIEIAPGYTVKACQHDNGGGTCQTYTASVNLAGTNFNDQISYLEVSKNNIENSSGGNQGNGVTVYAGGGFSGASWSIGAGTYAIANIIASPIGNDKASSIEIAPGYTVKACQHGNGGGTCQTYTASVNLAGTNFNNEISYLEVSKNNIENSSGGNQGNGVTVYAGGGFSGASWSIGAGTYAIADIVASPIGNDSASSIEIAPGYTVKACQHGNGGGTCQTYTSMVNLVGTNFNNEISYIEVSTHNEVTVYADGNFSGVSWGIWPGVYDIASIIASPVGNDKISSIAITPGYIVHACQHSGGRGTCQAYTASVDLAEANFNNQISYIEVIEYGEDTILSTDILGDVNCDEGISAVDALALLQLDVGILVDTKDCSLNNRAGTLNARIGDVNDDESMNALDALLILQCDVGLENSFCPRR